MKVLLTGGTGFIGSHLVKSLVNDGHDVYAVRRADFQSENIVNKHLTWITKSLCEINVKDLSNIDIIFHLASAGVSPKKATWEEIEKINLRDSFRLIRLAKEAGIKRMICAGTCLEYGDESANWEKIPPDASLKPSGRYAVSKAAAFLLLKNFAIEEKMEFFYGRIFSAFGDGQFKDNLWPSLKNAAISGKDFEIKNGEEVRDFIPVEKVVSHLKKAMTRNDVIAGNPLVVNIGSGNGMSVKDFVRKEWNRLNPKGNLRLVNQQTVKSAPKKIVANIKGLNEKK